MNNNTYDNTTHSHGANAPGIIHGAQGEGLTGNSTGAHENTNILHRSAQSGTHGDPLHAGGQGTYSGSGTGGAGVDPRVATGLSGSGAGLSSGGTHTVDVSPSHALGGHGQGYNDSSAGNAGYNNNNAGAGYSNNAGAFNDAAPTVTGHHVGTGHNSGTGNLGTSHTNIGRNDGHAHGKESGGGGSLVGKIETKVGSMIGNKGLEEKGLAKEQQARADKLDHNNQGNHHGFDATREAKRNHEGEDRFATGGGTF